MVTQVSIHENPVDGSMEMQERSFFSKRTISSEDYVPDAGSVHAIDGAGDRMTASHPDDMPEDARVRYMGLEMTVADARRYGVLDEVFREAMERDQDIRKDYHERVEEYQAHQGRFVNATTAEEVLDRAVEAKEITHEEGLTGFMAIGEMEMLGVSMPEIENIVAAYVDGDDDFLENLPGAVKDAVERHMDRINQASINSANEELGHDLTRQLMEIADNNHEVATALTHYTLMRAAGETKGLTWVDFWNDTVNHIEGRR